MNTRRGSYDSANLKKGNIYMVKIKVSFSDTAELEVVKKLLEPIITGCRVSKNEHGYKKAYIDALINPKKNAIITKDK